MLKKSKSRSRLNSWEGICEWMFMFPTNHLVDIYSVSVIASKHVVLLSLVHDRSTAVEKS
jgi:hypothetical protein